MCVCICVLYVCVFYMCVCFICVCVCVCFVCVCVHTMHFWLVVIDRSCVNSCCILFIPSFLRKKHCKYFNKGEDICPFGDSCFYKHGRLLCCFYFSLLSDLLLP